MVQPGSPLPRRAALPSLWTGASTGVEAGVMSPSKKKEKGRREMKERIKLERDKMGGRGIYRRR